MLKYEIESVRKSSDKTPMMLQYIFDNKHLQLNPLNIHQLSGSDSAVSSIFRAVLKCICNLIIGLTLLNTTSVAQELPCYLYTSKDNGLPQTQVFSVKEADDGCIWVGTYGGVGCFDGIRFRNFTEEDGLLCNIVYDLTIYRDTVFVLTRDGVNLIVNNKVFPYFTSEKIKFLFGKILINDHFRLVLNQSYDKLEKTKCTLFDLQKKCMSKLLPDFFYESKYTQIAFSKKSIFFSTENQLYEIPYKTGKIIHRLSFAENIFKLYLTKNKLYMLTGCKDGVFSQQSKLWTLDLQTGFCKLLPMVFNLNDENIRLTIINLFVPISDNKMLVFSSDGHIIMIDKTGTYRYSMNFNQFNSIYTDKCHDNIIMKHNILTISDQLYIL